jgi:hypothetical protein
MKALYKYPQAEYPYARLAEENRRRGKHEPELELLDTGALEGGYWDVVVEYAKASPEDLLVRITVANRGSAAATLHVLPQLWFRNTWSWGGDAEGHTGKPEMREAGPGLVATRHETLGAYTLALGPGPDGAPPRLLFTQNETNTQRLFGHPSASPHVKDAFHELVVHGREDAVDPSGVGTKCAAWHVLEVPAGQERVLKLRLTRQAESTRDAFGRSFDTTFAARQKEADAFYADLLSEHCQEEERNVLRQANAGLLWSKQFYHYAIIDWLEGDPKQPAPPEGRKSSRNADWRHLYNRDVISMPDKWEYPWFAAWDLAFHVIPLAKLDPHFA